MKIKFDPLIIYIITAIALAYCIPHTWMSYYGDTYDSIVGWGVSLIFFLYGIKIPIQEFWTSMKKWRVHLTVQSTTYLLFPLLILGFANMFLEDWSHPIVIGFLFLSVLPSTVSSSVVMTSWADGNVAIAVFNSFITGLLGIVLTPLWMEQIIDFDATEFNLSQIYTSLLMDVCIPLVLGLMLQRFLRPHILKYPNVMANYDKVIIFLIIFKAFSIVFRDQLFSLLNFEVIGLMLMSIVLIFGLVSILLLLIAKLLNLDYPDKMALYFCGVQKSFVHASVFSKVIFKNSPQLGFILMPTMIFHLFQIILTSILAQYFKSKNNKS